MIGSHDTPHEVLPPPPEVSPEFGRHLAAVCTGCHQPDLGGGKIVGGDPSWGPAANLTRHETGLSDWEYADFVRAMREGKRPDGTDIKPPMTLVFPYVQKMTEVELEALWTYIQSMPPVPSRS
jgi:mono/diheme cytochrome c family protein